MSDSRPRTARRPLVASAVCFFAAFVLQLMVNFSVPYIRSLYLFAVVSTNQDELRWGIWGACSRHAAAAQWQCTSPGFEYPSGLWTSFQNSIFSSMSVADGFVIQPIATALAGASVLLALFFLVRLRRNPCSLHSLEAWAICILALSALGAAAAGLALELVFFTNARNQVRANRYDKSAAESIIGPDSSFDSISSADLGPANWLQAAGLACAAVGCITAVFAVRKAVRLSSEGNCSAVSKLEAGILGDSVARDEDTEEMHFMHQAPSTAGLMQSHYPEESQAGLMANKSPDLRDPHQEGRFALDPYYADTTMQVMTSGSQTSAAKWHSLKEESLSPNGLTKGHDDYSTPQPLAYGNRSYGYSTEVILDTSAEYVEALSPSYEAKHESAFAYSPNRDSLSSERRGSVGPSPTLQKPGRSNSGGTYADDNPRATPSAGPHRSPQIDRPPTLFASRSPTSRLSPLGEGSVASRLSSRMSQLMVGFTEADDPDETGTINGSTGRRGVLRRSGSVRVHQAARMSLQSRLGSEVSGHARSKRRPKYESSVADDAQSELPPDESVMGQYDIYGAPSEVGGYSVADYLKPPHSPHLTPPQPSSPPASILKPPQHFPVRGYLGPTPPPRLPPTYDESEANGEHWRDPVAAIEEVETMSQAETEKSVDSWAVGPRGLPTSRARGRVHHPLRAEVRATPSVAESMLSDELEIQAADDETVVQDSLSRGWDDSRAGSKRPRPSRRGF